MAHFTLRLAGHEKTAVCVGLARPTAEAGQVEKNVVYLEDGPASDLIYPDRADFVRFYVAARRWRLCGTNSIT